MADYTADPRITLHQGFPRVRIFTGETLVANGSDAIEGVTSAIDPKPTRHQRQQARLLVLYSHANESAPKNQWIDVAA